jgi:holliday junction DNA helicase RuvA
VIASLNGTVVALESGSAVIDVSGVGYLVHISNFTANELRVGSTALVHTSLIVREDGFTLFGFLNSTEQRFFDLLRSVTGVGPKSALAIVGEIPVTQIIDAVNSENDSVFKAVSGIGPKTAKLIVLTLAGKLGGSTPSTGQRQGSELVTVITALTGLGWNERTAIDAANMAQKNLGQGSSANELLKLALANLGSTKSIGATDE